MSQYEVEMDGKVIDTWHETPLDWAIANVEFDLLNDFYETYSPKFPEWQLSLVLRNMVEYLNNFEEFMNMLVCKFAEAHLQEANDYLESKWQAWEIENYEEPQSEYEPDDIIDRG